ncbi:MAG: DUF423 domain-containing protein [Flavobacteriales bacterium]|nr:DUF423 domain-containing protein [Flavobacteriales bacterium]
MHKRYIRLASILMILGIIMGAFGAHFLKPKISASSLSAFQTGVFYHIIHAVAILVLGISSIDLSAHFKRSVTFLLIGIILFSGSLYLLSLKEFFVNPGLFKFIGPITPLGGISFIVGWVLLIFALKDR